MIKHWINSILKAFWYSVDGMKELLKERAFKQELLLGVILLIVELFRSSSFIIRVYLFSAYLLVLMMESVNSAIETAVDRIGDDHNPLSKKAKDIGSFAVFIALMHLGCIWCLSWVL